MLVFAIRGSFRYAFVQSRDTIRQSLNFTAQGFNKSVEIINFFFKVSDVLLKGFVFILGFIQV